MKLKNSIKRKSNFQDVEKSIAILQLQDIENTVNLKAHCDFNPIKIINDILNCNIKIAEELY